jgi:uncharacterized membrane protein
MKFETAKKLGLIGSAVTVLAFVAAYFLVSNWLTHSNIRMEYSGGFSLLLGLGMNVNAFTGLAGAVSVLFVAAMYYLSKHYGEMYIFKRVAYGFFLSVFSALLVLVADFAIIKVNIIPKSTFSPLTLTANVTPLNFIPLERSPNFGFFLIDLALVLGLAILNAVFYKRAFSRFAEKSGVDSFRTAGLLYFIGTLLTFVAVGALVIWVAWIYFAVAFYRLKQPQQAMPPELK